MIYGYIRVSSDKQTVENRRFEINNFCSRRNLKIDDRIARRKFCRLCWANWLEERPSAGNNLFRLSGFLEFVD